MKNHIKKLFVYIIFVSSSFVLLSCGSGTDVSKVWVDETYEHPVKKILVVGMAKDDWVSKALENEVRNSLKSEDVEVIAAWRTLPKDETISKETFEKYFSNQDIDAVLIVRYLGTTSEESVIKGGVTNVYVGYYGFYLSSHSMFFSPDYVSETKIAYVDAHLYDTKEGKLIFKTTSESFDPKTYSSTIRKVSSAIAGELEYSGLINN